MDPSAPLWRRKKTRLPQCRYQTRGCQRFKGNCSSNVWRCCCPRTESLFTGFKYRRRLTWQVNVRKTNASNALAYRCQSIFPRTESPVGDNILRTEVPPELLSRGRPCPVTPVYPSIEVVRLTSFLTCARTSAILSGKKRMACYQCQNWNAYTKF